MNITDIFIRRPVLALVVSLLIVVLGYQSYASLAVRQYPKTENAVVTVATTYSGADPDVIAGFITTPLENAIAQANGIDYMQVVRKQQIQPETMKMNNAYWSLPGIKGTVWENYMF